jgi:hypothetical protein
MVVVPAMDDALLDVLAVALLDMLVVLIDALLDMLDMLIMLIDDALLDMLELCFSIATLGELIIVDIVTGGGSAPAVTVIVIVHNGVDTTFWTGAINMHVESGTGADVFDVTDCAPARDAAARAVMA